MKSKLLFAAAALSMMMLPACVSTKKYQSLQTEYTSLQSRSDAFAAERDNLKSSLASAQVRIDNLESRLRAEEGHLQTLQSALDKCLTSAGQGNVNISKLVDEINSSNKYIQQLIASKNKSDS